MNYAAYCPTMGYNQGMSDLLAPILTIIQNESDAFWCFVGLMNRTIFISTPTDDVMEKQLVKNISLKINWRKTILTFIEISS
jgi:hypothetical protein